MTRAMIILASTLLAGCGRVWLPDVLEEEAGRATASHVLSQMPPADDSPWAPFVKDAGKKLAAVSERPDVDFRFYIVNSPEINAFAAPDGEIFVTTGLLRFAGRDSEAVAAVLAHEIGHVARRHGGEEIQAEMGWTTAAVAIFGLDHSLTKLLAGLAGQLVDLGYGRDRELEADLCSIRYLTRLGYPPSTGLKFLQLFQAHEHERLPGIAKYLASHPPTADRLAYAKAYAENVASHNSQSR